MSAHTLRLALALALYSAPLLALYRLALAFLAR